jgi:hypothetical protein
MATVTLSDNYYSQQLLAQNALRTITDDGSGEFGGVLNYFGFNSSTTAALSDGWSLSSSSNPSSRIFSQKVGNTGAAEFKNNTVTFSGSALNVASDFVITKVTASLNQEKNSYSDPKATGKTIKESLKETTTVNLSINSAGITLLDSTSDTTDTYINPENTLAVDPENKWAYPEIYKEKKVIKGEHFQTWDGTFVNKDIRSYSLTTDFAYNFDAVANGKTTRLTNSYKESNGRWCRV